MQAQRWRRRIGSNVARSYLRPWMTGSRLVKALDEVGGEVDQVLRRRCFERSGGFSTFPKACGGRAGLVEKVCDGAANTRDSPFYMDVRALVPPVSFPVCPRATHQRRPSPPPEPSAKLPVPPRASSGARSGARGGRGCGMAGAGGTNLSRAGSGEVRLETRAQGRRAHRFGAFGIAASELAPSKSR